MQQKSDRRALSRIAIPDAVVKYKSPKKSGLFSSFSESERVINLSKSGIAFQMAEPVEFGKSVELKLNFADGKTLKLKGQVRWQNESEYKSGFITGVQFFAFGRNEKYNSPRALEYLRSIDGLAFSKRADKNTERH